MKIKTILTIILSIFLFNIFNSNIVNALLPPQCYIDQINDSKIKAVAIVDKIEILEVTKYRTRKKVTFKLLSSFSKDVPQYFYGVCYSVDRENQEPMVGGTIYYYPVLNEKVYVTITSDNGHITSFNELSDTFKDKVKDNKDKIYPEKLLNYLNNIK